jgi:hypothetical protein
MKQATGGEGGSRSGVIGGALEKAGDGIKGGLKKLGVNFPSQLNPTSYSDKLKLDDKSKIPTVLSEIKGDAAGNVIGKLLSQPQTPNQLVRNAAGLAVTAAVGGIKNKFGISFGDRATTTFSTGGTERERGKKTGRSTINYGSNTTDIDISNEITVATNTPDVTNTYINAAGVSYSKTIRRTEPIDVEKTPLNTSLNFTDGEDEGEYSLANKTPSILLRDFNNNRSVSNRIRKFTEIKENEKTLSKRGFGEGTRTGNGTVISPDPYRDVINLSSVFNTDSNNTILGDSVDDLNFIPLKFTLLSNNRTIHFRSHIDGISETFSPSWDSSKFVGNPFSFYTYSGIERSVSFNLKIAATTQNELKKNWERLSFLSSMVYPSGYQQDTFIIPPFIKFTLGNLYKGKEGFIESLSFSVDENMGWEIGVDSDMKDYKLPMKIDVSIGIKFVESRSNTDSYTKLYSFKPVQ